MSLENVSIFGFFEFQFTVLATPVRKMGSERSPISPAPITSMTKVLIEVLGRFVSNKLHVL